MSKPPFNRPANLFAKSFRAAQIGECRLFFPKVALLCLAAVSVAPARQASAAVFTWDTSASAGVTITSGTWNYNTAATWTTDGTTLVPWTDNGNTAAFQLTTSSPNITIDDVNGPVGAAGLVLTGSGQNHITTFLSSGTAALHLGSGGITSMTTSERILISVPLVLNGSQTWSNTGASFVQNGPIFTVSGPISSASGATNLLLDGRGLFSPASVTNNLNRVGFIFGGDNTFTGTTTVTGGAVLQLDFSTNAGSKLDGNSALILAGSTLSPSGASNSNGSEVLTSTIIASGQNTVAKGSGNTGGTAANVQFGALTHTLAGTLDIANVSGLAFTTSTNTNGILGGWATATGGTRWATGSPDGTSTAIGSSRGTTRASSSAWVTGENANASNAASSTESGIGSKTLNSLRIENAGVTLSFDAASLLTLNSGGLLSGNTTQAVTGGSITTGQASGELFVHNVNDFTVGSSIVNNGTTPTVLVKSGGGALTLSGASTYTGGTYINAGSVIVSGAISGSVAVQGGATFDVSPIGGYTVASTKSLSGGGSVIGNITVANGGSLAAQTSYVDQNAVTQRVTATLSLGNNLTIMDGAAFTIGLGVNSSLLNLTGSGISLTGANTPGSVALNIWNAGGLTAGSTYTLMQWQPNAVLNSFDLTDFNVLMPNGFGGNLQFSDNSLTLTAFAIPEPTTWAMVAAGAGLLVLLQRRRGAVL